QTYSVLASVPSVSVSELRQAPTIYPAWVQRENLQLPTAFPESVRQQAWSVVGDATTVYDAAANMEAFLRTLPYKSWVRVPPPAGVSPRRYQPRGNAVDSASRGGPVRLS